MVFVKGTFEERYLAKVQKTGPDECWLWTAATTKNGYGVFRDEHNHLRSATRWAYGHFIAPVPVSMDVCHTCDNPPCHNPAHWFLGTRKENVADMDAKGRRVSGDLRGEKNGWAKLTNAQRADIQRRRPTTTLNALAQEYGVSIPCIWHIAKSPYRYDQGAA